MLLNMKELLEVADKNHFAVPAFNIADYAMFNGIMDISEKLNAPVIIEIHPTELRHIGSDAIAAMEKRISTSPIPAVIHLDHGASFEDVMGAIRAGFSSVMIDASSLSFEDNVAISKKVVEAAHAAISYTTVEDDSDPRKGTNTEDKKQWHYAQSYKFADVSVEAELGTIGVIDEKAKVVDSSVIKYTEPEDAVRFVKETGVDTLAVAIGTCHGDYPKDQIPELKLDRLQAIKKALVDAGLDTKLVLHGGSGNKPEELQEAAKLGISKINISTDIKKPYYLTMREVLKDMGLREPNSIQPPCIQAMQEVAAERIRWFGSEGKASLY
ncbi:class II fructose-bisphosphate aldolase [Lachnoclostridium sp. Marseille-P6806]|uniref:class II fructose-bisphosphate aldolase n=1 Tax=Lachnoclostridium sp. Marseille-P6806 TaxID=2364793 RepID=UPI0010300CC6|nr:class II fructose-bisphosphate aldolase [Lachnoclostridium sp. Marseille-P6806]